ncbi:unnamed protein product, partial [Discosporangium mesarthrocarpum]
GQGLGQEQVPGQGMELRQVPWQGREQGQGQGQGHSAEILQEGLSRSSMGPSFMHPPVGDEGSSPPLSQAVLPRVGAEVQQQHPQPQAQEGLVMLSSPLGAGPWHQGGAGLLVGRGVGQVGAAG